MMAIVVAVSAAVSAAIANIGDIVYTADTPDARCINVVHTSLLNQVNPVIAITFATDIKGAEYNLTFIYLAL